MYEDNNNNINNNSNHQQQNNHLVIPGQLIAVSAIRGGGGGSSRYDSTDLNNNDDSFLRGHGTYVEIGRNSIDGSYEQRLYASTVGLVRRVNKLISVETVSSNTFYRGQIGDLVIGRIISVANGKWKVSLGSGRDAILPLQGVHLPGGIQRIRTSEDALAMRSFLKENDLISAEVHKITVVGVSINSSATTPSNDGNNNTSSFNNNSAGSGAGLGDGSGIIRLHTRSIKYGKLENGCIVIVPSSLIQRRKNHYVTILNNTFQILLGCNGFIWIQRYNTHNFYYN
jgi:exosome complex component RRP4